MDDWNGTTSISMDLLDHITSVTDHKGRTVEYGWDAEGNRLSEMQYNHGQSGNAAAGPDSSESGDTGNNGNGNGNKKPPHLISRLAAPSSAA
ncbi:RHS repeat domain-containing protein [uncultured Subdoligranulum sp.]|uniref:RHS repeat domain-containing protein n=2 Tax=uncultured Subdoligranulum sp. TaxID=512298 RepID=UPI0025DA5860|nr:RHS repeat domain-containing protein [uncultured Subdoligranulum sp.]